MNNIKDIGAMMCNWHSSQSDPIYAVGSHFVAGMDCSLEKLIEAKTAFEHLLVRYTFRSDNSDLDQEEIKTIITFLKKKIKSTVKEAKHEHI